MPRTYMLWAGAAALVLFLITQTFYTVSQNQIALVRQFSEVVRTANVGPNGRAGLYVKAPFIEDVITYDKRNLGFNLSETSILAADQETLVVDAFVRWRIVDPLAFFRAVTTQAAGEGRLETITQSALRRVLGRAPLGDIISRRSPLMAAIRNDMNREAATQFGVNIIDVRIRQADLPPQTQARVFERMSSEREQVAAGIRAHGEEEAARVRADADRQVTIVQATARQEAATTRGRGDSERAAIFARAYGRNPEFAAFYRSLQAYEAAIQPGTPMIIPPESDFFRYLRSQDGRR